MIVYRDEPIEVWDAHVHMGEREQMGFEHALKIMSYTADELVGHMDEAGVDAATVFSLGIGPGTDYAEANRLMARGAREHAGRIVGYMRLNPNRGLDRNRGLIQEGVGLGLRGLKLHPLIERFAADDRELVYPLMEAAEQHRLVVLFHCGMGDYASPDRIARVARDFPRVNVIVGHSGLSEGLKRVVEHTRQHPNLYMETSAVGWIITLCDAVLWAGAERVLYGSDAPFNAMKMEVDKLAVYASRYLQLSAEDARLIMGGNLKRLLGVGG